MSINQAATAIVKAAQINPFITVSGLQDELARGDIGGWMTIVRRYSLTFSDWSGAMERAIRMLSQQQK